MQKVLEWVFPRFLQDALGLLHVVYSLVLFLVSDNRQFLCHLWSKSCEVWYPAFLCVAVSLYLLL